MAKYEDYVKSSDPEVIAQEEIDEAAQQQEAREDKPVDTDWEKRYKDLEVAYSRQGQTMGDYRKMIDEYVTTTPEEPTVVEEVNPITPDDIFDNPDEAVRRAVDSHPAIKEARQLKQDIEADRTQAIRNTFNEKHPDAESDAKTPEFANWVNDDPMRLELAQRGNQFDVTAADALFALWDSEKAVKVVESEDDAAAVDAASLETGGGTEDLAPERYSRSAMLEQKIRAKQGVEESRKYVKQHAVAYREALGAGLVRD